MTTALFDTVSRSFSALTTKGFYRKRPYLYNIGSIFLEAAKFALSVPIVTFRAFIMLIVCCCYMGRMDTRAFIKGRDCNQDRFPGMFLFELMQTDAHHHPYVECLGSLLLMKLVHPDEFATAEGSVWRLLYVLTLMPWLQKKRAEARELQVRASTSSEEGSSPTDEK